MEGLEGIPIPDAACCWGLSPPTGYVGRATGSISRKMMHVRNARKATPLSLGRTRYVEVVSSSSTLSRLVMVESGWYCPLGFRDS